MCHGLAGFVFLGCGLAAIDHGHIVAVTRGEETDSCVEQPAICLGLALVGVSRQYVGLGIARAVARRGFLKVIGQDRGLDVVEVAAALRRTERGTSMKPEFYQLNVASRSSPMICSGSLPRS